MIGESVSHYQILEKIGEGGMGVVYLAKDEKLHRRVALKFLPEELTQDRDRRQRFVREARAAAAIEHPNIAVIHEIDEVDGRTFIVMEYVKGRSLRKLIRPEGMLMTECLEIILPIAQALAKAHENKVVHRDVKPENVQVSEDGYPKLLDFGLAKLIESPGTSESSETATQFKTSAGVIVGTAAYMSPEQVRGKEVDARTDIFALGVVLYEMLTGRSPFLRDSAVESLNAVLNDEAPRVNPEGPEGRGELAELDRILKKALAKAPSDRYQSMGDFVVALRGLSATGAATSAPRSRFGRLAAAVAMLVVALIAGYGLFDRSASQPGVGLSGRPSVAILYFENNSGDEEIRWLSKGLPSMLLTDLSQTPGLDVVSSQRVREILIEIGAESIEFVDKSVAAEVARRSGAGAVVVGSIFKSGEQIRIDVQVEDVVSGTVLSAESVLGTEIFPLVDELTGRIRSSLRVREGASARPLVDISTHSIEAYRLYIEAREAAVNLREAHARRLYEEAVRRDPEFAMAHFDLSVLLRQWDLALAQTHKDIVLQNLGRLSERDRLLVESRYATEDNDPARAVRLLEQLITSYPDETRAYASLERAYRALGDTEMSLATLSRGVEANPASAHLNNVLGYAFLRLDRLTEALEAFRAYERIRPGEANPYDSQGEAYLLVGQPERAVERFDRALEIDPSFYAVRFVRIWANAMLGHYDSIWEDRQVFAEQSRRDDFVPRWQQFLHACLLSRVGRYAEAEEEMELGGREAAEFSDVWFQADAFVLAAWLALEQGDNKSAVEEAKRVLDPARDGTRSLDQSVAALVLAGAAEARRGQIDRAREHFEVLATARDPESTAHTFWYHALEGELALALGDAPAAKAAFLAGAPRERTLFSRRVWAQGIYANNLPFRDGIARAEVALGNDAAAIEAYRTLLDPTKRPLWHSWLEPRHVLALARLLDKTGDGQAARVEYERFLELWKNADGELPELHEAKAYLLE